MITITDTVRDILFGDDVGLQAAQAGLLNYSAYAEKILPLIQKVTLKPVKRVLL